jgi:transposase
LVVIACNEGPGIFWEKDWGTITSESYQQRIIPVVEGWVRMYPGLLFMQDNAPGHAAAETLEELRERGIVVIQWPPFSPDVNPIETLWNRMKDWIEKTYPEDDITYDKLREVVREAWDTVGGAEELQKLIRTMPERCQAVIDAHGNHTLF